MNSRPQHRRGAPLPAEEPIAIVGIAALYPGVHGADDYWSLLSGAAPGGTGDGGEAAGGLDGNAVDVARFGIPPVQAAGMARMQLLMLQAARECLDDAGYAERTPHGERTDVVVGTCFGLDRQYANALRIEGSRYARDLGSELAAAGEDGETAERTAAQFRERLQARLGASPHDRVGEMASTIPARIATAFKFRGRTLALESADATSFVCLDQAVTGLRAGTADAALVVTGQRQESPRLARAAEEWPLPGTGAGVLGEGAGALLLKRLSTARRDGDRIYARILGCALRHDARPGPFRHPEAAGVHLAAAGAAGLSPKSVGYIECAGGGRAGADEAGLAALTERFAGCPAGSVAVGSAGDLLGNTLANAGLASVSKVALALYHCTIPPTPGRPPAIRDGAPYRSPDAAEPWQPSAAGTLRQAAVTGTSLTGSVCHLVMEEHLAEPDRGDRPAAAQHRQPARPVRTAPAAQPIAVVGIGAYFAGAPDTESFWSAILSGEDRITPVPQDVLDRELYYMPGSLSLTHSYTDLAAPVRIPDAPPPGVRLHPQRYRALDGTQRVALSVAAELLARRGEDAPPLDGPGLVAIGSNLGLTRDRTAHVEQSAGELEALASTLPALSRLAEDEQEALLKRVRSRYGGDDGPSAAASWDGRLASGSAALIANEFGLHAVPMAVEAACASSLAALDVAVGALRSGAVDYCLAGGVELACNARDMVLCSALGLFSRGRITPFDAAADGFTPGDGCALFLLKRLEDALRDGDNVLGTVRAVGTSNDAKSLIAPDAEGQARAIRRAFEQVDFAPGTVGYLEAHGTGTKVGDRTEIASVAQVYADGRSRPLEIGSVKSCFGHTYAAAGAAGLLRALLLLRSGTIPPNANLTTLNPQLGLDAIPARVATRARPWPAEPGRPRRAAVSSFGTGGINYHLLLEEHLD